MFNKNVEVYPFINSPIANCHGEFYHMPFNMNTFHELWGVETPQQAKDKTLPADAMSGGTFTITNVGMFPIDGSLVADGEYPIQVESSSPFFRIIEATLTVKNGQMTADITIRKAGAV